jgi:hypothetical protein
VGAGRVRLLLYVVTAIDVHGETRVRHRTKVRLNGSTGCRTARRRSHIWWCDANAAQSVSRSDRVKFRVGLPRATQAFDVSLYDKWADALVGTRHVAVLCCVKGWQSKVAIVGRGDGAGHALASGVCTSYAAPPPTLPRAGETISAQDGDRALEAFLAEGLRDHRDVVAGGVPAMTATRFRIGTSIGSGAHVEAAEMGDPVSAASRRALMIHTFSPSGIRRRQRLLLLADGSTDEVGPCGPLSEV